MFASAPMKKLFIMVLDQDVRHATRAMGRAGVVHLSETPAGESEGVRAYGDAAGLLQEIDALAGRAAVVMRQLQVKRGDFALEEREEIFAPLLVERQLDALERELGKSSTEMEALGGELAEVDRTLHELKGLEAFEIPMEEVGGYNFLHFALGEATEAQMEKLREMAGRRTLIIPYGVEGDRQRFVAVTEKKGRFALGTALEKSEAGRREIRGSYVGRASAILERARQRRRELEGTRERVDGEIRALRERHGARLLSLDEALRTERAVVSAERNFARTSKTFLITGWVPADRLAALIETLRRVTANRVVVNATDPAGEEPPVLLRSHAWLEPFASLVSAYDVPNYREVIPTLFAAIAFLIMFGLMFADVGQGALLILAGLVMVRRSKSKAMEQGGRLFTLAGGSAVVFGFLCGSVFGREDVIHALWLVPIEGENIQRFLVTAVFFGVALISVGIILSIINRFRRRDFYRAVLDKTGVVGGIFYWGAVGLVIKAAVMGSASVGRGEILVLIALPLTILFFREPIHAMLTRRRALYHGGVVAGVMEAVVELLETLTSYLANTISFVRVGAFGLAHAGLFMAIFALEKMVKGTHGATVPSILILILGNALSIGLEGMVVVIQVLRLEYYEFFGKFFIGGGMKYEPFRTTG